MTNNDKSTVKYIFSFTSNFLFMLITNVNNTSRTVCPVKK